jgi:hypothetical protein
VCLGCAAASLVAGSAHSGVRAAPPPVIPRPLLPLGGLVAWSWRALAVVPLGGGDCGAPMDPSALGWEWWGEGESLGTACRPMMATPSGAVYVIDGVIFFHFPPLRCAFSGEKLYNIGRTTKAPMVSLPPLRRSWKLY